MNKQTHQAQNKKLRLLYVSCYIYAVLAITACSTELPVAPSNQIYSDHIKKPQSITPDKSIPDIVRSMPILTPTAMEPETELYSVVVYETSIREVLFAMARDAQLNVDIHPDISGEVSLNVINQSLPQILQRLARQADLRWSFDQSNTLVIIPDSAFVRTYRIDYVNVERNIEGAISVTSTIGDSSNSSSSTNLSQQSNNNFWGTLLANLRGLIGESTESESGTSNVFASPETGTVSVNANSKQHKEIQHFIDLTVKRALAQVLIEATIVEVTLNNDFQAGVDWQILRDDGEVSFQQNSTGLNLNSIPTNILTANKVVGSGDIIDVTIKMLSQFGDLKVLSSPKIMTLNNQAGLLKVVDNRVYFTVEVQLGERATATSAGTENTYTTTPETVPVGFVMAVTPQISESDQVTLNIRPTITRIVGFVQDPNPGLASEGIISQIPEIQVREIESILKIGSGQVAVLGGLMQDSSEDSKTGLPGAEKIPIIGNFFKHQSKRNTKTELIIFIRPTVINQPDINRDLEQFKNYLPEDGTLSSLDINL